MFVKFDPMSKDVLLYNDNNALVRRFLAKSKVVNAQITGGKEAIIAITCDDGHVYTYKTNGALIKKI